MKKTVGSEITHYHYDLAGQLICETDGSGDAVRDYVYLNGEPVAMQLYGDDAGWYYFVNDHLGTPQKVVDVSGVVVWEAGYLPFGEARLLVADIDNNLRFPGQYYDVETRLHYNWHRYYDPETGRYWSADPIGLDGGINLYTYAVLNPINLIDPLGLFSETQKRDIINSWRNTGAAAGAIIGFIGGGGVGGLTGPGAIIASPAGAYAGAATGAIAGGTAGQIAADLVLNMLESNGDGECNEPCNPPEGTRCYEGPDYGRPHGGLSPHYHIYEMQKKRSDGSCFWRYLGGKIGVGVLGVPTPGMRPCSSYSNFTGRGGR